MSEAPTYNPYPKMTFVAAFNGDIHLIAPGPGLEILENLGDSPNTDEVQAAIERHSS